MRSGRATILALDTRRVPALLQKTRLVDDQNRIWTAQLFHNVMAQLIPRSVCIPTSPVQQMLHPIGAASSIHSANCQPFLRSQPLNKPCKYARLRARGSERANNSAISPCARNNSRFHPDNRFSMAKNEELHPRANSVYHLSATVVLAQNRSASVRKLGQWVETFSYSATCGAMLRSRSAAINFSS